MPTIGNLICLTPLESYVVEAPIKNNGWLRRLERKTGPFLRSPGIGFPYMVGFLRKNGILTHSTRVVVQHDKIEGVTPFANIMAEKIDMSRGDHDVLFITAYTNSVREAYRRSREARTAYILAGKNLTGVLGGVHASAVMDEGTRLGHVDAVVAGEGEWAAAELLEDVRQGRPVRPLYQAGFKNIRPRGAISHFTRNYLFSRYGMSKTSHAIFKRRSRRAHVSPSRTALATQEPDRSLAPTAPLPPTPPFADSTPIAKTS